MANKINTKQILDLAWKDINRMKESELREAVRTLQRTSQRRIRNIAKNELRSSAVAGFKAGNRGAIKDMSYNQLRSEISRQREFLKNPLSTVRGLRKDEEAVEQVTREYGDIRDFMTKAQISTAYDVFDKLVELYPAEYLRATKGTDVVQVHIAEFMATRKGELDVDQILKEYMERPDGLHSLLEDANARDRDYDIKGFVIDR